VRGSRGGRGSSSFTGNVVCHGGTRTPSWLVLERAGRRVGCGGPLGANTDGENPRRCRERPGDATGATPGFYRSGRETLQERHPVPPHPVHRKPGVSEGAHIAATTGRSRRTVVSSFTENSRVTVADYFTGNAVCRRLRCALEVSSPSTPAPCRPVHRKHGVSSSQTRRPPVRQPLFTGNAVRRRRYSRVRSPETRRVRLPATERARSPVTGRVRSPVTGRGRSAERRVRRATTGSGRRPLTHRPSQR
jgi:hypothetical protein